MSPKLFAMLTSSDFVCKLTSLKISASPGSILFNNATAKLRLLRLDGGQSRHQRVGLEDWTTIISLTVVLLGLVGITWQN